MRRTTPFAWLLLAIAAAACGSTPTPEPAAPDPLTDTARREVVQVLADGSFRIDDREVSGTELRATWAGDARPASVEIRVADAEDPAQLLSAFEAAMASVCPDLRLVLPDGRASYLPIEIAHMCRAVEFQHGPASFGGHGKKWNYVFVDIAIPRHGPAVVLDVLHDDRRAASPDGVRGWELRPGWDRLAPEPGDVVDALDLYTFFTKVNRGAVEPLVRIPLEVDAGEIPTPSALVDLVNELVVVLGPRVFIGGPSEPELEEEISPEIDDAPIEAPPR